jgi:hypothetical protein
MEASLGRARGGQASVAAHTTDTSARGCRAGGRGGAGQGVAGVMAGAWQAGPGASPTPLTRACVRAEPAHGGAQGLLPARVPQPPGRDNCLPPGGPALPGRGSLLNLGWWRLWLRCCMGSIERVRWGLARQASCLVPLAWGLRHHRCIVPHVGRHATWAAAVAAVGRAGSGGGGAGGGVRPHGGWGRWVGVGGGDVGRGLQQMGRHHPLMHTCP